ncbi:DUF4954 family protein [Chitinophaga pollutisoli]|uniref:DUF4954 family protein n=1 Tax=Chitinophaga pollutisoli TaxID=3133966 RepID=A0ABZ2YV78_9BACT
MNNIQKKPLSLLGYQFVDGRYLPKGRDEYYLRDQQRGKSNVYRKLKAGEIETLVRNDNTSDDWNNIFVDNEFDPHLVQHCQFYGIVRIGKLEPYFLEFHNLRLPVGLYYSTIASCDIGDNVVIHNVNSLSHYIIGNDVIISNVNELGVTDHSKFGNGILKEGEPESVRIWLELCNENGGRSVLPFDGMLPGDAWFWTRNRADEALQNQFKAFTEKQFDKRRGYYGEIGDRTVIKNCKIIKDTKIGTDAYLKGANKIKNVTLNSDATAPTQIGEGCELVNGIIGYGCRVFYGVKAVRFVMASHSQLKYGARLINSYLGNNATISCCEVLNSLIFPAHEQHHNNSFLCAALIMGQSNMAAGATIGSNHNSRGADGEIIAGRGFWPGLCVSLKHNSMFASFTLIAKGNYMSELKIPIPFSLVVNDEHDDMLKIMPGYWFLHNMYALARNAWKYVDRDRRTDKTQHLEFDYLAPDSIEEVFTALELFETAVGKALGKDRKAGRALLLDDPKQVAGMEILAEGCENSSRKTQLLKVDKAYPLFRKLVTLYAMRNLIREYARFGDFAELQTYLKQCRRSAWNNVGGQLIPEDRVNDIKQRIRKNKIGSWDALHEAYRENGERYEEDKLRHSLGCLLDLHGLKASTITADDLRQFLADSAETLGVITENIRKSREKDYINPFRQMTYESPEEMENVVGKLDENSFILQTAEELKAYRKQVKELTKKWQL